MAKRYEFTQQPEAGKFGKWKTADGFICFTNQRLQAVRWYKKHLEKKQTSK